MATNEWSVLGQYLTGFASDRYAQKKREEELARAEKLRLQEREEERRDRATEFFLQGRGGVGERPTVEREIGGPRMPPPPPANRDVFEGAPSGQGVGVRPGGRAGIGVQPPPVPRVQAPSAVAGPLMTREPDLSYQEAELGGVRGYFKTPEAIERERLAAAEAAAAAERERQYGAIRGELSGLGVPEEQAGPRARLFVEGGPASVLTPPEPDEQRVEMKQLPSGEWVGVPVREGRSGVMGRLPETDSADDPAANRYARAVQVAQELDMIARMSPPEGSMPGVPASPERVQQFEARKKALADEAVKRRGFTDQSDYMAALQRQSYTPTPPPPPAPSRGVPFGRWIDPSFGAAAPSGRVAPARQPGRGPVTESGPDLSSTPPVPGAGGGSFVTTAPPELLGDVAQDYQFSDDPAQAMRDDGWGEQDIAYMMDLLGF